MIFEIFCYIYRRKMNRQQAFILILLFVLSALKGISQVSFDLIISNYNDTSVLLASYYGEKNKLIDTAYIINGKFIFSNKEYPEGVYILASQDKNKLFEFIINNETGFSFYTDARMSYDVEVRGSEENRVFYEHQRFRNQAYREIRQLTDTAFGANAHALDSIKESLIQEERSLIKTYPDLFIARLIKAQQDVVIPDSLSLDSMKSYLYTKEHYWDNLNLSDARFIRTPVLEKKLNFYFDNIIFLHPDSVIKAIDTVISYARPDEEAVSYLLWYFISKYQNPKYMGFDKVFVHLVDNYFLSEDILNTTSSITEKLKERSEKIKPLLIGKTAPNLNLIDTGNRFRSFREIRADYTLLLFWDYNCHVCENTIEQLKNVLDTTSCNIKVYAICVNNDLEQWKKTIAAENLGWLHVNGTISTTEDFHDLYDINGTPRVFLLGSEKKIIAKNFKVAQLIAIIENQNK